jgi:hypothetical protein
MASSSAEVEDMRRAVAMAIRRGHTEAQSPNIESARPDQPPDQRPGIAGLDRKAMEEERLARLARKRERSVSPPPLRGSRKAPKLEEKATGLSSGPVLKSFSTAVSSDQLGRKSEAANAANQKLKSPPSNPTVEQKALEDTITKANDSAQGTIKYPRGVVKKTWAFGFERIGDDIKLEEVLEPLTLRTAVLSAFQWDSNWVLAKLKVPPQGKTKCIFVMQAKEEKQKQDMLATAEEEKSWFRLCFPPMPGNVHCMHSKLMLLFHPNKLRIVIPTANLLDFDWGETGVMENSVFLIDLPRLPDDRQAEFEELTSFAKEMLHYLKLQGLDRDVRDGVLNFDFSATKHMMFVHTSGGMHYGENMNRTGLTGLARAVRELGLQTDDSLEIDFAASSIGSLNDVQLEKFHAAARGKDLVELEKEKEGKAKAGFFKPTTKSVPKPTSIRENIRIYFPTEETVTLSKAGAAGTICLQRNWFEGPAFPRSCFRDYRSTRTGLLSHNKILYARGKQTQADGSIKNIAWAYVGSSNMSESAWGKVTFDKKERQWKIGCRNWECGVLLPVPAERMEKHMKSMKDAAVEKEHVDGEDSETASDDSETESEGDSGTVNGAKGSMRVVNMEVFDQIVKPPFEMHGRKYDGRQPWYFTEKR